MAKRGFPHFRMNFRNSCCGMMWKSNNVIYETDSTLSGLNTSLDHLPQGSSFLATLGWMI
jgi:hypothetical protein